MSDNILKEKKKIRRWWDDDGDGIGYEPGEVSGKFKKKKVKEALDPVGQEDADIDNDGDVDKSDSYLNNRRKVRKKIIAKEGFSNWRQDLSEVIGEIKSDVDDEEEIIITGMPKGKKNQIKINPNLGEAVEDLGGTLLEMIEIQNFESVFDEFSESDIFFLNDNLIEEVVEEVFAECTSDGYNIFEIENVLIESLELSSSLLNEARVTYGHDTATKNDRLEKVKSAVKKVAGAVPRAAGYVAGSTVRGVKAVGREFGKGYKRGKDGSSSSSSGSSRSGLLGRIGSKLKSGLKKIISKGARKVAKGALGVARRMEKERPSSVHSKSGTRSPNTRRGIDQGKKVEVAGSGKSDKKQSEPEIKKVSVKDVTPIKKVSVKDVTPIKSDPPVGTSKNPRVGHPGKEKSASTTVKNPKVKTTTIETPSTSATPTEPPKKPRPARRRRGGPSVEEVKADIDKREEERKRQAELRRKANEVIKNLSKEEFELDEKTLTSIEKKKMEEIAKSMNLADFERRYPGRGMEVKMATATKIAKKMV